MADPGCGRGGRGALLLAALERTRRPGIAPPSSTEPETPQTTPPPTTPSDSQTTAQSPSDSDSSGPLPKGRSAFLLGHGLPSRSASEASSSASSGPYLSGRGALLQAAIGRGIQKKVDAGRGAMLRALSQPQTPTASPISSVSHSPPLKQMEEVRIDKVRGTDGTLCNLEVNYVRLKVLKDFGVFEYHVNFNPPVDSISMRFRIIKSEPVYEIVGKTVNFDGAKLRLPIKLPSLLTEIECKLPTDGTFVMVHLKFVGKASNNDLIQHYNVLLKRVMNKLQMTLVGRNYFDHRGGIEIPQHKLEVWPGYTTAVAEFDDGVMLNCDASFRVLQTVTAKDILVNCFNVRKDTFKEEFQKKVIGTIILTRYNNKTYRIDDVAWDMTPTDTFKFHTGEEISYVDYYKNNYDIVVRDLKQPLLLHQDKLRGKDKDASKPVEAKLICLIPELCYMTGLTDDMRSNFTVMKDIAVHTRVTPNQRQLCLQKYIDNVNNTPEAKKLFSDWGVELLETPLKVDGRILDSETITVGRGITFKANKEADWGREIGREHVLIAVPLNNWVIFFTKRDQSKAQDFHQMLLKVFPQMGVKVVRPKMVELMNDRTDTYLKAAKDEINPQVQVLVFVMPTPRDDRYNAVKKLCCVEMPIASQVVNARTICQPQKLRSVSQKIALQINCKLGGELWGLSIPLKKTMICGIDVYHDPARKGKSVVGFVSSLNNSFTRWHNTAAFQDAGQELADCLRVAFLAALRTYHEVNHFLPDKIVIFRDGVGDGQIKYVRDYEIDQLKKAFAHFNGGYDASLIVIIVQKRINTRLFLDLGDDKGTLQNPPPGTVLDHTVTKRSWYDFYLISQHVRQGTVSPTHYVVVLNQSQLKPDHLQKLSYKLTHMYWNWPGTVRVPAPCQYAHKLAYLTGNSIHSTPSKVLSDRLFFL